MRKDDWFVWAMWFMWIAFNIIILTVYIAENWF